MKQKMIILNDTGSATLTPYLLECGGEFIYTQKRPAILVVPGGAYQYCSAREAEPIALAYNAAGYHAFVLRYSVGAHFCWPRPLQEFEEAMRLIRQNAEEWGVETEHIAAIGFSAGGHLAACGACLCAEKPFALLLGYPATSEKLGNALELNLPAPEQVVCGTMPPVFLFASRNDSLVESNDIASYLSALSNAGVSFESHIYSYADHGFSLGTYEMLGKDGYNRNSVRVSEWFEDSLSWLRDCINKKCTVIKGKERDGKFPFLSSQNTIGYILLNKEAKQLLENAFGTNAFCKVNMDKTLFDVLYDYCSDTKQRTEILNAVARIADDGCSVMESIKKAVIGL